jgi:hypothetical protein
MSDSISLSIDLNSPLVLTDLEKSLQIAVSLDFGKIKEEFEKRDWSELGLTTIDDITQVIGPYVPQAFVVSDVVRFFAGLAQYQTDNLNQPLDVGKLIQGIAIAEGLDWNQIKDALMGHDLFKATTVVVDDVAKIIYPFVPIPTLVLPIITAMVMMGRLDKSHENTDISIILEKLKDGEPLNDKEQELYKKYIGE